MDRQPFTLILVRRHLEGKVVRQISVDTSRLENNVEDPPTDPTFCEVGVHMIDKECVCKAMK